MSTIQFIQTTPAELQNEVAAAVKVVLDEFLKHFAPKQPNDYLTRKEVAELFHIDLSTLNNWCKSGKLHPVGLGNRVYFVRSEIENSMVRLRK